MNIYLIKAENPIGYEALRSFVYICESEEDCHKYVQNLDDSNDSTKNPLFGYCWTETLRRNYSITKVSDYIGTETKPFVLIADCTGA